ncbi:hypothetical protein [Streptomyces europaeiscabiei]|uniref:Secreted protein n=1 Tax=Streptomyces europaeiscabiei TaxID=146819 RepID=A0ABU4NA91_9ACTN|nr:hypothetical protein [Streptomyces europaeiscabiei]MDX2526833.1 hypothetical protein [Streptomyces europaeiscabiei]MDX3541411.1 hypothetical protein [Streptomyces europaeiscabiei]MDX3551752.1 hypothetical protein [Streptomyces europaeiscabiei]MDX3699991.1 hypothetical protein [Streptomyces europaeiscabiei]MDX3831896.1 hypothetical protein [Streptomyces europaeiscabiei]
MRKLAVGALAVSLFAMGAGTAVAASWHDIPTMSTGGGKFHHGDYRWHPAGTNHGAFEWQGQLQDTDHDDDHNVYMQVKVEGYDWSRYYGKQKKTVSLNYLNWAPAQQYTDDAYIRICRDKGSLNPDNCSSTKHYQR